MSSVSQLLTETHTGLKADLSSRAREIIDFVLKVLSDELKCANKTKEKDPNTLSKLKDDLKANFDLFRKLEQSTKDKYFSIPPAAIKKGEDLSTNDVNELVAVGFS